MAWIKVLPAAVQLSISRLGHLQEERDGNNSITWPLIQRDTLSEPVRTAQYMLRAHGILVTVDGISGSQLLNAIAEFRSVKGIGASTVTDEQFWRAILVPSLRGDVGDAVRAVQSWAEFLHGERYTLGENRCPVDGVFGAKTEEFVRNLQVSLRVQSTGIVDTATWQLLLQRDEGAVGSLKSDRTALR